VITAVVGKTTYQINPRHVQWLRAQDGHAVAHVKIVDGIELKIPFDSFQQRDNWLQAAVWYVDKSNEEGTR
jgi:hypothetical protein